MGSYHSRGSHAMHILVAYITATEREGLHSTVYTTLLVATLQPLSPPRYKLALVGDRERKSSHQWENDTDLVVRTYAVCVYVVLWLVRYHQAQSPSLLCCPCMHRIAFSCPLLPRELT